ncbi:Uncharacterised protein [Bordetella ansorpii]|uniref:Uncharacterized protein n=1 Tax=Bordetella ansorpii TaxID=288768 RepID=A0A146AC68_9BORD|nr:Uncharacterised protein [Bordetella ansorpii]
MRERFWLGGRWARSRRLGACNPRGEKFSTHSTAGEQPAPEGAQKTAISRGVRPFLLMTLRRKFLAAGKECTLLACAGSSKSATKPYVQTCIVRTASRKLLAYYVRSIFRNRAREKFCGLADGGQGHVDLALAIRDPKNSLIMPLQGGADTAIPQKTAISRGFRPFLLMILRQKFLAAVKECKLWAGASFEGSSMAPPKLFLSSLLIALHESCAFSKLFGSLRVLFG